MNILKRVANFLAQVGGTIGQSKNPEAIENETAEKLRRAAEDKYERLYVYASELLKEELDRFNRADEKAARLATTFVFLVGASAFFDKQISDKLLPPRSGLEWGLVVVGSLALLVSFIGWFMANWVGRMRGYSRLPLNDEVFDFFDQQPLLNFYGSFSQNIKQAFQANLKRTDEKHALLIKAFYAAVAATLLLITLVSLYGLYSWQNPGKFDSMSKHPEAHSQPPQPSPPQQSPSAATPTNAPQSGPADQPNLPKPDSQILAPNLFVSLNSQPIKESESQEIPDDQN